MSDAKDGLQIVAVPPSGWCDPATGTCYIETDDEAATARRPTPVSSLAA